MRAPDVSPDYFHRSTPTTTRMSVFNNWECNSVLQHLDQRRKEIATEKNANLEEDSKKPKIMDLRELPDNHHIKFSGDLTLANDRVITISLIKRVAVTKQIRDSKTLEITDVPCTKKLIQEIVIGTENDQNKFAWKKVFYDSSQETARYMKEEEYPIIHRVDTDEKGKQPVRSIQIDENKNEVFKYKGSDFQAPKKR